MKRYAKWALLGAGVAGAAIGAAATAARKVSRLVVDVALNRDAPKQMQNRKPHRNAVSEETKTKLMMLSDKLRESDCEIVTIYGRDGEKLVGHWHHQAGDVRVIIAMHGWRSSWHKDFGPIADFWHANGCSVLYAEQRGQNNSGGKYMGFGMTERYDCLKWIAWVNAQTETPMPLYLAGISMGASTVLMTGGFSLPDNVCGIMADCGFTSAHAIWKHVVDGTTHFSYDFHKKLVEDICRKRIQMGAEDYTTLDAMKENKVPVLFIHGTDDTFVPIAMTYENYKACTAPKRLFVVPGATHAMSYMVDPKGYEETVTSFWQEFDMV